MTTARAAYAKNHLLRLARPLFWILDELGPELESVARLDALQTEARIRLATFKSACYAAALRADAVEAIHYCFCAAMDQAGSRIHGRAGSCRGMWLQRSLLKEHYDENGSGKRCRAWIAQLQQHPKSQADALTVIGHLIARGLRDDLGAPLPSIHPADRTQRAEDALLREPSISASRPEAFCNAPVHSCRWGKRVGRIAALISLALSCAVAYVLYYQHVNNLVLANQVAQLSARVFAEQVSVDQRLARLLAPDIAAGGTSLGKRGDRVYLLFSSDAGFTAGKAEILPQLSRQLDQLAMVLAGTEDPVTVIGHTDASVGRQGGHASNLALSQARAMAVGRYLQEHGAGHGRISIIGRGAADPVGDNRTEAGRALNRRIEIVIDRR
ncbi:MAG: OmpA family protein [Cupriavidus sp.]|nr:OmpA family protein [Cupriavidus sp.]